METGSPLIELEAVGKFYGHGARDGGALALCDVWLSVASGEFLSVMGPSGCGKSTLLNLVAGLDSPSEGTIRVAGQRLEEMDERRRSELRLATIGLVFQSFHLLPRISVERNVTWRLELAGVRGAEALRRTRELLERLHVPERAWKCSPVELSGGEQQRVALARALATRPSLLLADEPTGNLDSVTGRSILDLLRELNDERRTTIVMVTHDAGAAASTDRIVELRDGRVQRDSRPERCGADRPARVSL